MAKLTGGIFSTPSGSNNGLTFGKARTRDGKKVTVRRYTKPTNPNTEAQQSQRSKFSFALELIKKIHNQLSTLGFNGAISNLPAFHGLMSYFLPLTDADTGEISKGDAIFLGSLSPLINGTVTPTTTDLVISFSSAQGLPQDPTDIVHAMAFRSMPFEESNEYDASTVFDATRGDGTVTLSGTWDSESVYYIWIWAESVESGIPSGQKYSEVRVLTTTIP